MGVEQESKEATDQQERDKEETKGDGEASGVVDQNSTQSAAQRAHEHPSNPLSHSILCAYRVTVGEKPCDCDEKNWARLDHLVETGKEMIQWVRDLNPSPYKTSYGRRDGEHYDPVRAKMIADAAQGIEKALTA